MFDDVFDFWLPMEAASNIVHFLGSKNEWTGALACRGITNDLFLLHTLSRSEVLSLVS